MGTSVLDQLVAKLRVRFPNLKFFEHEVLAKHTYFKIGGPADIFCTVRSRDDFVSLVSFARRENIPLTVLGGGSNVIVSDAGIHGLVVQNACADFKISGTSVDTEAGVVVNLLVRKTVDAGLKGFEHFMGLPGTVGGAVYNNSHYKKELIANHLVSVEVVDSGGELKSLKKSQLEFGYDYSSFQATKDVIVAARFMLQRGDRSELEQIARAATKYRAETQPLGIPSSGCVFKNVPIPEHMREMFHGQTVVSAGWLIDQAGLKGLRIGDAVVSNIHANFIVNLGSASAADVTALVDLVQSRVQKKYGLKLEREVFSL